MPVTSYTAADAGLSYLSTLSASQGYQILTKNLSTSVTNFEKTSDVQSDISYFEANAPKVTSVQQFLNDPKLLDFVLSAFDLDSEAQYPGLIKQVLTQDPNNQNSLVNQLTDPRFKQLATALDFYDDGVGKLTGLGLPKPTTATSSEPGVTAPVTTASKAASTAVSVGFATTGNNYITITKPDGTTAYTQSAYFTVNANNQLALPDGSLLSPAFVIPTGATAVTINSAGTVFAQVPGSTTPTNIGTILDTSFARPSQLTTDSSGYLTPNLFSGSATPSFASGKSGSEFQAYNNTYQSLVNDYVTNEFEVAVGDENDGVREALYFNRVAGQEVKAAGSNVTSQADVLLGDTVLRDVTTTALNQPAAIAEQPLEQQEQIVESGVDFSQLENSPTYVNQFLQRYLSTYDANNTSSSSSTSPALQILNAYSSGDATNSTALSTILNLSV